jgi:signal transduction histidine kinase
VLDEAVPPRVLADPQMLGQALGHLLDNAVKFTEAGEVSAELRHGGVVQGDRHRLDFIVRDTGIGLPADALARLFEPFNQADDSMARRHGGPGLGLTLARELCRLMGGQLGADSRPGHGSTFRVSLLLAAA